MFFHPTGHDYKFTRIQVFLTEGKTVRTGIMVIRNAGFIVHCRKGQAVTTLIPTSQFLDHKCQRSCRMDERVVHLSGTS